MCLITPFKRAKVLKEDLTVYKILTPVNNNTYNAYYFDFNYELGKCYTTKFSRELCDIRPSGFVDVDILNASIYDVIAERAIRMNVNKFLFFYAFKEGFHFFYDIERIKELYGNAVIVECTIPKGSKVYRDLSDLGVANQIIINKEVPDKLQKSYPIYTFSQ